MKVIRRSERPQQLVSTRSVSPGNVFFFYEKNSGIAHFQVEAGPDGRLPVDQAAGLLAMHCLVRGQAPSDYMVMVQAQDHLLEDLSEKAGKLLEAGRSVHSSVRLTRREEEVLAGVTNSLSNKEIAANLNLSERTVKFHVSSLLAKFQVRGRMELVLEVAGRSSAIGPIPVTAAAKGLSPYATTPKAYMAQRRGAAVVPLAKGLLMA